MFLAEEASWRLLIDFKSLSCSSDNWRDAAAIILRRLRIVHDVFKLVFGMLDRMIFLTKQQKV